jgi:hypothetical protein
MDDDFEWSFSSLIMRFRVTGVVVHEWMSLGWWVFIHDARWTDSRAYTVSFRAFLSILLVRKTARDICGL